MVVKHSCTRDLKPEGVHLANWVRRESGDRDVACHGAPRKSATHWALRRRRAPVGAAHLLKRVEMINALNRGWSGAMRYHLSGLISSAFVTGLVVGLSGVLAGGVTAQLCGDCDRNDELTVAELVTAVRMSLTECPTTEDCCGDCDANGRVSISELITAINIFLGSNPDPLSRCGLGCFGRCYFPIPGDPPCPCPGGACTEFPILMEPDRTIRCEGAICYRDDEQFRSCILLLQQTTTLCREESPQ